MKSLGLPLIMVSWLSEPAEIGLGSAVLIFIVAVIARAAFSWRADGRMDFLIALMKEWPADDIGASSDDLPTGFRRSRTP
jgi:hypothetical protein